MLHFLIVSLRYEQVPNFGSLPNKLGGFFICTKKINSYNKESYSIFFPSAFTII